MVAQPKSSIHGLDFDLNPIMKHGWKIDAKEIEKHSNTHFIETTVPDLTSVVLRHLTGLEVIGNPTFQIDIEEIVLFESGGHFIHYGDSTQHGN